MSRKRADCPHCGKTMTEMGLKYHLENKVCRREPEPEPEPSLAETRGQWRPRVMVGGAAIHIRTPR